jgi:hypothetical protein
VRVRFQSPERTDKKNSSVWIVLLHVIILIVIVLIEKQRSIETFELHFFPKNPSDGVHFRLCLFSKTPKCSKRRPGSRGFKHARISTCAVRRYCSAVLNAQDNITISMSLIKRWLTTVYVLWIDTYVYIDTHMSMIGASRESVWNPSTNCNGEEKWPDSVTCGESYYTNELYFAPERRVRIF